MQPLQIMGAFQLNEQRQPGSPRGFNYFGLLPNKITFEPGEITPYASCKRKDHHTGFQVYTGH